MIDQRFVSGIGNIYASEILYLSKIHPLKAAKRLNKSQCKELILNSKKILLNAIKKEVQQLEILKIQEAIQVIFKKNSKFTVDII